MPVKPNSWLSAHADSYRFYCKLAALNPAMPSYCRRLQGRAVAILSEIPEAQRAEFQNLVGLTSDPLRGSR
ncbi:hypothetical protein H6G00_00855 [Leptolyngbya sp. FACHB-541]|uniref:hypothetical protein n=1 Tax=Leptolyngbya sp. FACHB-541 TaxID=2692810 RepID=UPI0016872EF9|nr:hypothetical protein [Leptolyngbya sp. FACHB-541]MBD1995177.1 hypothetical protein [Leptolyngbya sp. FACHB-541]